MEELNKIKIIDIYETNAEYFMNKLNKLFDKSITLDEIHVKKMVLESVNIKDYWNFIVKLYETVKVIKINTKFFTIEKDYYSSKIEMYIKSFGNGRKGYYRMDDDDYDYIISNLPIGVEQLIIYIDNYYDDEDGSAVIELYKYSLNNLPNSLKLIKINTFYDIDGCILNIRTTNIKLPHECKFILNLTPVEPNKTINLYNFENIIEQLFVQTRCKVKMIIKGEEKIIIQEKYIDDVYALE